MFEGLSIFGQDSDREKYRNLQGKIPVIAAAHRQITEKKYEAELVSRGFASEKIRKYGFAFRGKECLIG